MNSEYLMMRLFTLPGILIGLTVHEFAHALMAYYLGDDTAKLDGRITLNPIRHIDPLGFILLITAGFGWAKPVMFNPYKLSKPHRDEILVSLAGPVSNIILAFLIFGVIKFLQLMGMPAVFDSTSFNGIIMSLLIYSGYINIALFIFNLIPIPPLDGSHVYMTFLKDKNQELFLNLYRFGMPALFVIIMAENYLDINILHISEMVNWVLKAITSIFNI